MNARSTTVPDGREAVRRLLDMGHKAGIIGPRSAKWTGCRKS